MEFVVASLLTKSNLLPFSYSLNSFLDSHVESCRPRGQIFVCLFVKPGIFFTFDHFRCFQSVDNAHVRPRICLINIPLPRLLHSFFCSYVKPFFLCVLGRVCDVSVFYSSPAHMTPFAYFLNHIFGIFSRYYFFGDGFFYPSNCIPPWSSASRLAAKKSTSYSFLSENFLTPFDFPVSDIAELSISKSRADSLVSAIVKYSSSFVCEFIDLSSGCDVLFFLSCLSQNSRRMSFESEINCTVDWVAASLSYLSFDPGVVFISLHPHHDFHFKDSLLFALRNRFPSIVFTFIYSSLCSELLVSSYLQSCISSEINVFVLQNSMIFLSLLSLSEPRLLLHFGLGELLVFKYFKKSTFYDSRINYERSMLRLIDKFQRMI